MRDVSCARRLIAMSIPTVLYMASLFMTIAIIPISGTGPLRFNRVSGYEAFRHCFQSFYFRYGWDWGRIGCGTVWMANPAIWCAFVFIAAGRRRMAVISAITACALALAGCFEWTLFVSYPGFWFWWGSMVTAILSECFLMRRSSPPQAEDYGPLKNSE
jgi:hypothetical protein